MVKLIASTRVLFPFWGVSQHADIARHRAHNLMLDLFHGEDLMHEYILTQPLYAGHLLMQTHGSFSHTKNLTLAS